MNYRYVIIGGGMAADAAAKALNRADPAGKILLISDESDAPYRRPPLSKGLWSGDDPEKAYLGTGKHDVELVLGDPAVGLDTAAHTVSLSSGRKFGYQRLLLATGARARTLPSLAVGGPVLAYRSMADFREAKRRSGPGKRVLVVGGGFIGAELAAALTLTGSKVHMAFQEEAISALRFPLDLALAVTEDYRSRGVEIHARSSIAKATTVGDVAEVELTDGTSGTYSLVILGVGAAPNDELAKAAGLRTDNGVEVDTFLRATSATDPGSWATNSSKLGIYAAGDVASFPWTRPFARGRIEHEDNAIAMGAYAGRQMAASFNSGSEKAPSEEPFNHFPFFYSDLFDNGYEAVGTLDSRLETFSDWRRPYEEGVVYYLDRGLLVGVVLWNTWGQVDEARDLLLAALPIDKEKLRGRLPR